MRPSWSGWRFTGSPFQVDHGGIFELPAQHQLDVVALANNVIAGAAFGDLVKVLSKGCLLIQRAVGIQSAVAQPWLLIWLLSTMRRCACGGLLKMPLGSLRP